MFTRLIKDEIISKDIETVPINTIRLHPISLNTIKTHGLINPICLTKMKISDDKLNTYSNYVCKGENKYKEYVQLPPIGFESSDLLQIYSINNIDNLQYWIESNIEEYNIFTLRRVLNCWINNNIDVLKIHNNFLENICKLLLEKYMDLDSIKKIDLDKEVKYYIDYWIEKYDKNSFVIDLLDDLKDYLIKKNEKK
jgi:hypothetical protein